LVQGYTNKKEKVMSKVADLHAEFTAAKDPEVRKQILAEILQQMDKDRENMDELFARHEEVFGK
jgi:acyl-CoA reductase-like NAD-dependent aldehyde dehydrogenase